MKPSGWSARRLPDADDLWAFTAGGRLTLNARKMLDPEMVPSLVHEAAHAFQGLVEATAGPRGSLA